MLTSPWLKQLSPIRAINTFNSDMLVDLAIIGGGIAGISTAYFILKNTNKNITLVEANLLAHGATGHNAGQILADFEKPFSEIVKEYGLNLAIKAQDELDQAWLLLEEIIKTANLTVPLYKFTGKIGFSNFKDIFYHLKQNHEKAKEGMPYDRIIISENLIEAKKIPKKYKRYFIIRPQKEITLALETKKNNFIAVGGRLVGCMNSALFVEELAGFLLKKFPERFKIYENSKVDRVVLTDKAANLIIKSKILVSKKVILCTNGYENFDIINLSGPKINESFHHNIQGCISYMAGYRENSTKEPSAAVYYEQSGKSKNPYYSEPYFYLTRRPYEVKLNGDKYNLVCIGGPETFLEESETYQKDQIYPLEAKLKIDQFIKSTLETNFSKDIDYKFFWHGLMGYTQSGIRNIGPDPANKRLLYNLGCNGIGILPSIYGGKRISQFILRNRLSKSIFDPK